MSKESFVRDSSGTITHVRYTDNDGRESRLYEAKSDGTRVVGGLDEVATHSKDGTTKAYHGEYNFFGSPTKGAPKK